MRIKIICVGKIKEPYLRKSIDFYKKKIAAKCPIEIIEVEDEKTPDHASAKQEGKIKQIEGERIFRHIPESAFVYALCIDGKQLTSKQLQTKIKQNKQEGKETLVFVIGGSLGLANEVIRRANEKISFSAMTFPHQMMRMILLEQLNRVLDESN